MGRIHVRSNLGELLKADIEMTGVQPGEMDAVRVGLASIDTFQALNVDYASSLSQLRFALSPNPRGALIRVSSVQPITDPYLRFVVEAKAPSGRSVREYTVLLDPANYNVGGPNIVQDVPSYADSDQAGRYQAAAPAKPRVVEPTVLKVRPGATLRSLAQRVKPWGASLRQTMAALVQANPDAFAEGDVNHPKPGSSLTVPSARKMKALGAAQVASILGDAAPAAASAGGQSAAPAGKGGDVLKLVPGDGSDNARLNDLQQQINAREKALQEASARITALEQELKAMRGGQPLPAKPVMASAPMAVASVPAAAPAASAPKPMPKPEPAPHPLKKPAPAHAAPPMPPPNKSLLDKLLDHLPLIGGGVGVVALLGLLGAVVMRRRAAAGSLSATSATLARSTVTGHGPSTVGGSHSFMSNFTQAAGAIDAAEVDPVAEAEVYIAYGRDQQAEEILKDALQKDPSRHEVRMKLMEVYAARPDTAAFERLAKEMNAAFDGKGGLWARTVTLGRAIDPDNPLYQMAPDAELDLSAGLGGGIDLDQELFGEAAPDAPPAAESAPAMAEEADPLAALFDTPAGQAPAAEDQGGTLDFDLEAMLPAEAAPVAAEEPAPAGEASLLDFDFNLDAPPPEEAKPAAEGGGGLESLYEDMLAEAPAAEAPPAEEPPAQAEGMSVMDDPLSTKLDLAKVYLDMGDREGAREVLQDLVSEAQGALKEEAKALLDKISV
ncbi:FimV/HubP family polar landmark protein [Chromobacterium subtsugae]|uniref:FimV/HubP family polar landmark protein n=1 Tax=Chromobacterium subtsugae TaxID=251747 RepID=UPI001477A3A9|nr:FimV/HubP family polar landmark protein [Chromobacterium subtsugae]